MTGSSGARCGFTLAETLVTLGIFALVVVAISDVYVLYTRAQQQTLTREKIVAEAGVLLDEIARQVRTRELVFFGVFDYDGPAGAATDSTQLYSLDGDGGPLPTSWISNSERELALADANGDQLVYWFNSTGLDYCRNPSVPVPNPAGLYVFSRTAATGVLNCNRLFAIPNVTIESMFFFISPPYNPYPDRTDDCRRGDTAATTAYNGYYCTCSTVAPVVTCPSFVTSCLDNRCQVTAANLPNQQPRVTMVMRIRDDRYPTSLIRLQTTASSRVYKR